MVVREWTEVTAPQRTPEWFAARAGRLTGSRAGDMLSVLKGGGESAARRDLKYQLVAERLSGQPQDGLGGFVTDAMQRGIELEDEARRAFEAHAGALVSTSGFIRHERWLAGCSLDGHLGDFEGLVEIKCPKTATHLRWMQAGVVPVEHRAQLTHNAWVLGPQCSEVFFVSYDNRLPLRLQLFVVRVPVEGLELVKYEAQASAFLAEVDAEVTAWETR